MRQVTIKFRKWVNWIGIPQVRIAEKLECSQETVSKLYAGKRSAGLALAIRIEQLSRVWPEGPISVQEWTIDEMKGISNAE